MSKAPVLIVKHVPWEGPHRIADALTRRGLDLDTRYALEGDQLPEINEVSGAVFMGGPMNVDEVERWPGLLVERDWLAEAVAAGLPVLGVCLGSQLIARALGSKVTPGPAPEIGWAPVTVSSESDALAKHLAPGAQVLHWHGDVFTLPKGGELLASSAQTEVQGFRVNNAWGFLFHAEADATLTEQWLAEPSMLSEAEEVLGPDAAERLRSDAADHDARVKAVSTPMFDAFAELIVD